MIVVNFPTFFDLVHPDSDIITANAKSPIMNVEIPNTLGMKKSLATTFSKYPPGVVIMEICTMAKTVTRKQPVDKVAAFKIAFASLSFLSETIKLATMAIENPLNKALIRIV